MFRIEAPGGAHLLVRRHGSPELALWLPAGLAPSIDEPFGLYLHVDCQHAARIRATSLLARAIGRGLPIQARNPQAHRHATMLCIHDLTREGATLRDIGAILLDPAPDDWRTSSERSDLRRLVDAAAGMAAGDFRSLLLRRRQIDPVRGSIRT